MTSIVDSFATFSNGACESLSLMRHGKHCVVTVPGSVDYLNG